jgi:hypothetical protein
MAVVLFALSTALVFPLVARGASLARLAPEVADLDQRMRVLDSLLHRVLESAGAGAPSAALTPTFAGRVPGIFPALRGVLSGDAPNAAFPDRVTVLVGEAGGWDVALASSMLSASSPLFLLLGPPCPVGDARCSFRNGDTAVLNDRLGYFDLLRITNATGPVLAYQPSSLTRTYQLADDSRLVRASIRQLRFDGAKGQVRFGDGLGNEAPVMDGVVSVAFAFQGVAEPPKGVTPPLGTPSCLTNADGSPRLPVLPGAVGGLVGLPLTIFTDGPFCGGGAMVYDADLFRIRRVRVRIGIVDQNALPGQWPWSPLARSGPTREVTVDVAPRNLAR